MEKRPSYQYLLKRRDKLIKKLGDGSFVLRGSLRRHGNKCGKPGCACKHPTDPKLHGPYDYLSHRYGKKTRTIFLNRKKLIHAKKGIKAYNKLLNNLYLLSEINFRILRYHYGKLEDKK